MSNGDDAQPQAFAWARTTVGDIEVCDIDAPLGELTAADPAVLAEAYQQAAIDADKAEAGPLGQVYWLLNAATGMYQKDGEVLDPYGAMLVMGDRRTAILEDFRGPLLDALACAATRTANVVLRARLSDIVWLLDRRRAEAGRAAQTSFVEIAKRLSAGTLAPRFPKEGRLFCHELTAALARALEISRVLGWERPESLEARTALTTVREQALQARSWPDVHKLTILDLKYGVSDPASVAASLEEALRASADGHDTAEFWRLAARAHNRAADNDGRNRCLIAASETFVRHAEGLEKTSPMIAAHWLSQGIAQLHGVPGMRDRRKALHHKLVDIQAGIPDEMTHFSHPVDLRAMVEDVERRAGGLGLRDLLFFFAEVERSPNPKKLIDDARASIEKFPLSTMMPASFHDRDGKVTHRTDGQDLGDASDAIRQQIARAENIRRKVIVEGAIEPLRRRLQSRFYLGRDTIRALLLHSPFVPESQLETYCGGIVRLFGGDFASALFTLTPLLESSLRHVLRLAGHDVAKFDDAAQTQQDRTISQIFEQMRPALDKVFGAAITTDIENVFLAPLGPSLRHAVAHGLIDDGVPAGADSIYGCWLIFRLCCLPLFRVREEIELPE